MHILRYFTHCLWWQAYIEDQSLSVHGYQLLPQATSQSVNNNREFDVSGIF